MAKWYLDPITGKGILCDSTNKAALTCDDPCGCCCRPACLKVTLLNWPPVRPIGGAGPLDGVHYIPYFYTDSNIFYSVCVFFKTCVVNFTYDGVHYIRASFFATLYCYEDKLTIASVRITLTPDAFGVNPLTLDVPRYPAFVGEDAECDQTFSYTDDDSVLDLELEADDENCTVGEGCNDGDGCTPESCCEDITCAEVEVTAFSADDITADPPTFSAVPGSPFNFTMIRHPADRACLWSGICESDLLGDGTKIEVGAHVFCDDSGEPILDKFWVVWSHVNLLSGYIAVFGYVYTGGSILMTECGDTITLAAEDISYFEARYNDTGWSFYRDFGADSGSSIVIAFKDICADDEDCGYDNGIPNCEVECIECDDCPPYCPDEGGVFCRIEYEMPGNGECGDCFSDLVGDGCGFCCDCSGDCNCMSGFPDPDGPPAAPEVAPDCPCATDFPVGGIGCGTGATTGYTWWCDPDCEWEGYSGASPCSRVADGGGVVDLPLISSTSTTMTFEDVFFVDADRNLTLTVLFDCVTKVYTTTASLSYQATPGRCVGEHEAVGTCEDQGFGFSIEFTDTGTNTDCINSGNGVTVFAPGPQIVREIDCPV